MKKESTEYRYKEHPKTCAADDFEGQVSRTVRGTPISQEHVDMIVQAIRNGITLTSSDVLLDIGCGNGALSRYFFNECGHFHGIDYSEYLIKVAKSNFERKPTHLFTEMDAVKYVETEPNAEKFTKALCYGAFTYFSFEKADKLLAGIAKRFPNINLFFIGNLPDKERSHLFFSEGKEFEGLLDDPDSPIGIWRSKKEFRALASKAGWDVEFSIMPDDFYSAHYRYDALLRRPKQES